MILPFVHLLASSFSSREALIHNLVTFWPVDWTTDNYQLVWRNQVFWNAFRISVLVTVVGTLINMYLTLLTAYPLSRRILKGKKAVLLGIVFTMIFSAPLIPSYLVIKSAGLMNTLWAIMLPNAIAAFNLILCISFFRGLPEELAEAAKVDGMSDYRILWRIFMPLSMPIVMTLTLFYAVGHWNNYMGPLFFITDPAIKPLQLYLFSLLSQFNTQDSLLNMPESISNYSPLGIQMATVGVATLPVMLIYPFIQRHFIRGALLGSIKE
ncbi:carbohydrate ABC transporter permease [Paenibacillus sp. IB182496]|uniref:Carbohydrate ABC transporter permease n=1 Tax=Paenibacillus sabuli TaxID=2772509 RepID=A0A927GQB5_9BACL|nr:carbohydrate ABC transporter permease [Paenibacillus sabuli]